MENEIEKTKLTILIVDDGDLNREILNDILSENYNILMASNGLEALQILTKKKESISAVLLDLNMPVMNGFQVLKIFDKSHWNDDFPIIIISTETDETSVTKAFELGAQDYIVRPFVDTVVREKVDIVIKTFARQKYLMRSIHESIKEKEKSLYMMVEILAHMLGSKNGESEVHVKHIGSITRIILESMQKMTHKYEISNNDIQLISLASALHDIGKITVPDRILNKPGKLTDEEFKIVQYHTKAGFDMIDGIQLYKDEKLVQYLKEITLCHHEKWDGRGYPNGLKGDEIPISAQVVGIADAYDALTTDRCYRKGFSKQEAYDMIMRGECGTFNPVVVEAFTNSIERIDNDSDKSFLRNQEENADQLIKELFSKMETEIKP